MSDQAKASTETFLLELTAYKESAQVNRFQWTPWARGE